MIHQWSVIGEVMKLIAGAPRGYGTTGQDRPFFEVESEVQIVRARLYLGVPRQKSGSRRWK